MKSVCIRLACSLALVSAIPTALAQESGSGSTTDTDYELQQQKWEARQQRSDGFRQKMLSTRQGMQLFAEYTETYRRRRRDHADDCRLAERKANRTSITSVVARCYRTSLLMEQDYLNKQIQYVESLPGVTAPIRSSGTTTLTNLHNAIDAITSGIDRGVFDDLDQLREAKYNLYEKYRSPAALAITHVRADRTLTWIAHVMDRMLSMVQNADLHQESFDLLQEASFCYEKGESYMQEVLQTNDVQAANLLLSQSLQQIMTCGDILQAAYDAQTAISPDEEMPIEDEF